MEEKVHVQVKDNSPSIERISRPITYMSWFLGVGIAHPRKCPKAITIIIRIIHMVMCSYTMIDDTKFYFPFVFYPKCIKNVFAFKFLNYLNRMMCYISTLYYIYYGIKQYNKWPELMDRLKKLDQNIRKEISINDWSIKIVEALAVFITLTFFPLVPIIPVLYNHIIFSYTVDEIIIRDTSFFFILVQSLINSFVFDVVVYVLYCRFQTLNKLICQLDKLSDIQWIAFKIRRIRELHADICDLASMVNDIHGLHLFFCSGNCFTMAIISLYFLFHSIFFSINFDNWLSVIRNSLCIVYSMQFCLICWICTLACEESNRTGRIIYKVMLNRKPVNLDKHEANNKSSLEVRLSQEDANSEQNSYCSNSHNPYVVEKFLRRNLDQECVPKEVNDFSIQLQQNRVVFTACNFFEINNASFGWFVGVIVTYLIIILQLYSVPVLKEY